MMDRVSPVRNNRRKKLGIILWNSNPHPHPRSTHSSQLSFSFSLLVHKIYLVFLLLILTFIDSSSIHPTNSFAILLNNHLSIQSLAPSSSDSSTHTKKQGNCWFNLTIIVSIFTLPEGLLKFLSLSRPIKNMLSLEHLSLFGVSGCCIHCPINNSLVRTCH